MNLLKGEDISNSTIANNPQNANDQIACKFLRRQVIGRDTLYESNIRKAPVSPGELIEPGYNTEASTRNIAQEAQNVNEDVKYKLNPEHEAQVRAYNEHITRLRQREEYLRGQGMSENAPAMINLRKAQEQAIYARDHIGEVDENGLKYKLSPEQETFFKDSKIRDENGNLKTVYHGTSTDFNQFDPDKIQQDNLGKGFYFTDNKDIADSYASRRTRERGGDRKSCRGIFEH